ncbi:MAG: hypothetical protein ACLQU3_09655 [Limisphaerales bacterium]
MQGRRVSPDLFTQLYRGGFVFKDPHGRWAITEMGKGLIEQNKLFLPDRCLVDGVECARGWNKQEIHRLNWKGNANGTRIAPSPQPNGRLSAAGKAT